MSEKNNKRAADGEAEEGKEKKKKQKGEKKSKGEKKEKKGGEYSLNINKAVDKAHENKSFADIVKLPPSALQGLSEKADASLADYNVKTIRDMSDWKYYNIAVAIAELSKYEVKGKREDTSRANINKAMDRKHEKTSLKGMLALPLSAFSGLTDAADTHFTEQGVTFRTIGDLAKNKAFRMAQNIVTLAGFENADMKS